LNSKKVDWPDNPAEKIISAQQWRQIGKIVSLTPREQQVTKLLLDGLTRDEIAAAIELSPSTIGHHMEMLYSKLRVNNRVGVALRIVSLRDQLTKPTSEQK